MRFSPTKKLAPPSEGVFLTTWRSYYPRCVATNFVYNVHLGNRKHTYIHARDPKQSSSSGWWQIVGILASIRSRHQSSTTQCTCTPVHVLYNVIYVNLL